MRPRILCSLLNDTLVIFSLAQISHSGMSLSAYFLSILSLNFIPVISLLLCAAISVFSFPCPVRSCSSLSMLTLLDEARLLTPNKSFDRSALSSFLKFISTLGQWLMMSLPSNTDIDSNQGCLLFRSFFCCDIAVSQSCPGTSFCVLRRWVLRVRQFSSHWSWLRISLFDALSCTVFIQGLLQTFLALNKIRSLRVWLLTRDRLKLVCTTSHC